MTKKEFRKYMKNTNGKVFNDRFYKENSGLKTFSNLNNDPQAAIKYSINYAINLYRKFYSMGKSIVLTITDNSKISQQVYKQLTDRGIPTELVSTSHYKKLANILFDAIKRSIFLYKSDRDDSSYNMTDQAMKRDDVIETELFKDLCFLLKDKYFTKLLMCNHAKLVVNPNIQDEERQLNLFDAVEYTWDMATSFQDDYQMIDSKKVYRLLGIIPEQVDGFQMYKFNMHKRHERPNSEYFLTLMALLYDIYKSLSITFDIDNDNYTNLEKVMMSAPYIISINK